MCKQCNDDNIIEKQIENMLIQGKSEDDIIKILAECRVDRCLPVLQQLLSEGYNKVKWFTNDSDYARYDQCSALNGQEWDLQQFINDTNYDAPVFCRSHPQCLCHVEVYHENGTVVKVDWTGLIL